MVVVASRFLHKIWDAFRNIAHHYRMSFCVVGVGVNFINTCFLLIYLRKQFPIRHFVGLLPWQPFLPVLLSKGL